MTDDRKQYTPIPVIRQPLDFPLHPLPSFVREVGFYAWAIPTCNEERIIVCKFRERAGILDNTHNYLFDEYGRCPCEGANNPFVKHCRHEKIAATVRKYFCCYRCGIRDLPHRQFEIRFSVLDRATSDAKKLEYGYVACTRCEADLAAEGFDGLEVGSYVKKWFGAFLTPNEAKYLLKFRVACASGDGTLQGEPFDGN